MLVGVRRRHPACVWDAVKEAPPDIRVVDGTIYSDIIRRQALPGVIRRNARYRILFIRIIVDAGQDFRGIG